MRVSVVVCTRNRLSSLTRCVAAFGAIQTSHAWELIVVDNGSSDGTFEYLRQEKIRFVTELRRGASNARNAGFKASTGDIIAFIDDDCYATPTFIDDLIFVFSDERIGYAAGRVLLYDPKDIPLTIKESNEPASFPPHSFIATGEIHGCNMAFRRDVLSAIGGFDERFAALSGNDIEAIASASWAGFTGVYDPRPTVYHHHRRRTKDQFRKRFHYYDIGRGAYYAKFILRKRSMRKYLFAWLRSLKPYPSPKGVMVSMRRASREARGFLAFVSRAAKISNLLSRCLPVYRNGPNNRGFRGRFYRRGRDLETVIDAQAKHWTD